MNKMPMIFVGHGSPMNAIEKNRSTDSWKQMANKLPKPKAILAISAHWYTKGTRIMPNETPRMIYDMYGFPRELYEVVYGAKGSPELAEKSKNLLGDIAVYDDTWGFDHGTWSVLVQMYPEADIPVYQISVDADMPDQERYEVGKKLQSLRDEGVMIFASGNIVHNLRRLMWDNELGGYDWANDFDTHIRDAIVNREYDKVINFRKFGEEAMLSVPTPDHYVPIIYLLGAATETEKVSVYNDFRTLGSLSMTSYIFEE